MREFILFTFFALITHVSFASFPVNNNQHKTFESSFTSESVEENQTNQILILKKKNFFKSLVISLLSILVITFLISLLPIYNTNDGSPFGA
tara:strand:+ start:214 stop:486 length:273 start_codon:yes stop_codon:yes gene_type:complete